MALKDVVIQPKKQEPDALDKVAKGLQIAQGVLGTAGGVSNLISSIEERKRLRDLAAEERLNIEEGRVPFKQATEAISQGRGMWVPKETQDAVPVEGGKFAVFKEKQPSMVITPYQSEQIRLEEARLKSQQEDKYAKSKEKEDALVIPGYGIARTEDDAKKLKDALVSKDNLVNSLDRIIELREKYGAELFDRDVVAESKQLATDVKLTAKNLAQLGVLSKSDEQLLNRLVPEDPTEWKASSLIGQDPVLTSLKNYRNQSLSKFDNALKARLKQTINKQKEKEITPEEALAELERRKKK